MVGDKDGEARRFLVEKFLPVTIDTLQAADKLYQQLCNQTVLQDEELSLQVLSEWKEQEKKLFVEIREVFMRFEYYDSPFAVEPFKSKMQSDSYASDFYAALCNNDFEHESGEKFCCSWRFAGGVVAQIREQGEDYIDFYCRGSEGNITDEVLADLTSAGWKVITEPEDNLI